MLHLNPWRAMRSLVPAVVLLAALGIAPAAYASHYQGGYMSISIDPAGQATGTMRTSWTSGHDVQVSVYRVDGGVETIIISSQNFSNPVIDSTIPGTQIREAALAFDMSAMADGEYIFEYASCCWVSIQNGTTSSWRLRARVNKVAGQVRSSPRLDSNVSRNIGIGLPYRTFLNGSDPEGSGVGYQTITGTGTFGATSDLTNMTLSSVGEIVIPDTTTSTMLNGQNWIIKVRATDVDGDYAERDIMLTSRTTSNQLPVITVPQTTYQLVPGQTTVVNISASDSDPTQNVTLVPVGLPSWATFTQTTGNPSTGVLTMTPPAEAVGQTFGINIEARDSDGTVPLISVVNLQAAVNGTVDVSLTAVNSNPAVAPGGTMAFTIAVSNAGPDPASAVQVSFPLPVDLTHVSDTSVGTYNPGSGVWNVGTLLAGETKLVTITVTSATGAPGSTVAELVAANGDDVDSTPGNHVASEDDQQTVVWGNSLTSLSPTSGLAAGGTLVRLTGTGFASPFVVTFGGVPATSVVMIDGSTLDVITPALAAGAAVDVSVTLSSGTLTLPSAYLPVLPPHTVTAVWPTAGVAAGGVRVRLSGTGFTAPLAVNFGGVPAAAAVMIDSSTIEAITPGLPPGTPVDVSVVLSAATLTLPSGYLPLLPPPSDSTGGTDDSGGGQPIDSTQDTDGDGLPDVWEIRFGLDPNNASDAAADPDHDGVSTADEYAAKSHPSGTFVRYISEGAVNGLFSNWLALYNTDIARTTAVLRFLTGTVPVVHTVDLQPGARVTLDVRALGGLGDTVHGVEIEAAATVVAERTMTWDGSAYGAHTAQAVQASTNWFFAEGATHSGFDLFYLITNPRAVPANVTITYLTSEGTPSPRVITVAPNSRETVWVNVDTADLPRGEIGASVTSDQPIVVDRSMYLRDGTTFVGGTAAAGSSATASTWYFAEGVSNQQFSSFLLLANPEATDASVDVTLRGEDGAAAVTSIVVPGHGRANVALDSVGTELANYAVTATTTAPGGIVAERAVWWSATPGGPWIEGHSSEGATTPGAQWASAEVLVGFDQQFDTFLLIANTDASLDGTAEIVVILDDGRRLVATVAVGSARRTTVRLADLFGSAIANGRGAVTVTSIGGTPAPLVVERSTYWNANGESWAAGVNVLLTRLR